MLVSVIIPCYNHGRYLQKAIKSVLNQSYKQIEIIVVDDGSIDNTPQVAKSYGKQIRYIYKENGGLSAARNTGIECSSGEFIVFLDADDWLYPHAVETNLKYLKNNESAAFVSGSYTNYFDKDNTYIDIITEVASHHYLELLKRNYVGMVASVMFRKWVLDEIKFDTSQRYCEDFDIYLRIARKYEVVHHLEPLAVYHRHSNNMSANIALMVSYYFRALLKQKDLLVSDDEKSIFNVTYNGLYKQILETNQKPSEAEISLFKKDKFTYYKHLLILNKMQLFQNTRTMIKKKLYRYFASRINRRSGIGYLPPVGQVFLGDFNRTSPFSRQFGYDRGGPVDRYYIESFLQKESAFIKGTVLEIGDNFYTTTYGKERVSKSDILHVDSNNEMATYIGDISSAPHIPDNEFDCIILTQTLHLIYNYKEALNTCFRILKPGGTLLATVPGITQIDKDDWNETWYYSFTDKAMKKIMAETFPGADIVVNHFGNVLAATAFLYGMASAEIPKEKLDVIDPYYQVIVTIKATKP